MNEKPKKVPLALRSAMPEEKLSALSFGTLLNHPQASQIPKTGRSALSCRCRCPGNVTALPCPALLAVLSVSCLPAAVAAAAPSSLSLPLPLQSPCPFPCLSPCPTSVPKLGLPLLCPVLPCPGLAWPGPGLTCLSCRVLTLRGQNAHVSIRVDERNTKGKVIRENPSRPKAYLFYFELAWKGHS